MTTGTEREPRRHAWYVIFTSPSTSPRGGGEQSPLGASLNSHGYMARGGQIIDASIVLVPTQRNSRDENAELQAGRTPAGWKQQPAKVQQKDRDARWTKKHGRSFFGYKNHVNADPSTS